MSKKKKTTISFKDVFIDIQQERISKNEKLAAMIQEHNTGKLGTMKFYDTWVKSRPYRAKPMVVAEMRELDKQLRRL